MSISVCLSCVSLSAAYGADLELELPLVVGGQLNLHVYQAPCRNKKKHNYPGFRIRIHFFPDPDPASEAGDQSGSGSNPDPGL